MNMLNELILYIQRIIFDYGAWGVFMATAIEEIIAPIPSPVVPLAAGFFIITDKIFSLNTILQSVLLIAVPVTIGVGIFSSLIYVLGYFGGKPIIIKLQKYLGITWSEIESTKKYFSKRSSDEITIFILRLLPIMPGIAISIFCGIVRYSYLGFLLATLLGSFIRALILGLIGWQVGKLYNTYAIVIAQFEKYFFIMMIWTLAIAVATIYIMKRRRK